jgi:hypothetical protein
MKKKTKYALIYGGVILVGLIYWLVTKLSKFQKQVVNQANLEADKWILYNELDEETALIVQDYWNRGVGLNVSLNQVLSEDFQDQYAWSAAFTSWVMNVSGAGDSFPYSATHSEYIIDTTNNRYNNPEAKFKAYDTNEQKPKPSDLVCTTRSGTTASYGDVQEGDQLHCDIVTKVHKNSVIVVGGNVNNKVQRKTLSLDSKGYINDSDYFVLIKNKL